MPELNPYEPPQSELRHTSSEKSRATVAWTRLKRYTIPALVGLQVGAGGLAWLFDVLQALAHSNYQRLQAIATFFGMSFLVLGLLLILFALWRGSLKLLISEFIALGLFVWSTLPKID